MLTLFQTHPFPLQSSRRNDSKEPRYERELSVECFSRRIAEQSHSCLFPVIFGTVLQCLTISVEDRQVSLFNWIFYGSLSLDDALLTCHRHLPKKQGTKNLAGNMCDLQSVVKRDPWKEREEKVICPARKCPSWNTSPASCVLLVCFFLGLYTLFLFLACVLVFFSFKQNHSAKGFNKYFPLLFAFWIRESVIVSPFRSSKKNSDCSVKE